MVKMKSLWANGKRIESAGKLSVLRGGDRKVPIVSASPEEVMVGKIREIASKSHAPARFVANKSKAVEFPPETVRTQIQWPAEQKLQEVLKKLVQIRKAGMDCENAGDHFNSGDLAYQLQEIIRSTGDLFQKVARIRK